MRASEFISERKKKKKKKSSRSLRGYFFPGYGYYGGGDSGEGGGDGGGGGESVNRGMAEGRLNEIYKMPPTKDSSQGMTTWAYNDAVEKKSPVLYRDDNVIIFKSNEDLLRYIILQNGNPVLYIGFSKFLDGYKSGTVATEIVGRGKGLAQKAYLNASDILGVPIYSDTTQTDASRLGIWDKLIQQYPDRIVGYDQKTNKNLPLSLSDMGPVVNQNQPIYVDRNKKDTKKPISPSQRYRTRVLKLLPTKQGMAEGFMNEFAPGAGSSDDEAGDDPYKYPKPTQYRRSADYFGQFEADHFDREDFDDATGEFKGYWGDKQIAYFKFDNPAKTSSEDPGMGWYYEPESSASNDTTAAKPAAFDNSEQRKQQELGMIDAFLKSGRTPTPGSQIYSMMKRHGVAEGIEDNYNKNDAGIKTALQAGIKLIPIQPNNDATGKPIYIHDNSGRYTVAVDMGGISVPFYNSTGQGGKVGVAVDKWYPFFGIGPDGWINKGSEATINDFYGSDKLKRVAQVLDNTLGLPSRAKNVSGWPGNRGDGNYFISIVNRGLDPAAKSDRSTKLRDNMLSVLRGLGEPNKYVEKAAPVQAARPKAYAFDKNNPEHVAAFDATSQREREIAIALAKDPKSQGMAENFADGRNPQDKGDAKRHGINTKASVSSLRKTAKQGGRKGQLAHWLANMKAGRAKKK